MKYTVNITSTVEVELDESKFTDEWMTEWRDSFYPLHSVEDHAMHIAQLCVNDNLHREFTEGYGPLRDMGISAEVVAQDQELESTDE